MDDVALIAERDQLLAALRESSKAVGLKAVLVGAYYKALRKQGIPRKLAHELVLDQFHTHNIAVLGPGMVINNDD